jgi:D-alanyl-D-alanine carboxypeptidase (penicillin-binding protein 5/6)
MMTLYETFQALHKGRIHWNTRIRVTRRAAKTVPMKLGLREGSKLTVREAVLSMVTLSANDAAEALCDYLAGKPWRCGAMLTRGARRLGLSRTTFRNGSGLPDKRQVTTARDMAKLGLALMRTFPKEYKLFSTRSFNFRGRIIHGHNHLMYRYPGMDGIKTGFTGASGFNIVTAVNRNGKHVVGVVMGGRTSRGRDRRMAALLDEAMPRASSRRHHRRKIPTPKARPQLTAKLENLQVPVPKLRYGTDATVTSSIESEPAKPAATGAWSVQIAAVDSEDAARSLLRKARTSASSRLKGTVDWTEQVRQGNAALVRARFTGFATRHAARLACHRLKAKSFHCFVLAEKG